MPKRRAKKTDALGEAAVAVGGQGGRRVPATALSSLCRMVERRFCNDRTLPAVIMRLFKKFAYSSNSADFPILL